jgi:hypothetical protein
MKESEHENQKHHAIRSDDAFADWSDNHRFGKAQTEQMTE